MNYDDLFYYHLQGKIKSFLPQLIISDKDQMGELYVFNKAIFNIISNAPRTNHKKETLEYFNHFLYNNNESSLKHNLDLSQTIFTLIKYYVNNSQEILEIIEYRREKWLEKKIIEDQYGILYLKLTENINGEDIINTGDIFKQLPIEVPMCKYSEETLNNLHKLKNQFNFKTIVIEAMKGEKLINNWAIDVYDSLIKMCETIDIPHNMVGLNGHLSLIFNLNSFRKDYKDSGASATTSLSKAEIHLNVWDKPSIETLLIHEYTHIADAFAGYAKKKTENKNIKENEANTLCEQVLSNIEKLSTYNSIEKDMADIICYLIGNISSEKYIYQQNNEKNKLIDISKNVLNEACRKKIPHLNLPVTNKIEIFLESFLYDSFKNHETLDEELIKVYKNLLEQILIKEDTFINTKKKIKEHSLDIIKDLHKNLYEKLFEFNYSVSDQLYFFSKSEFSKKSLIVGYQKYEKYNDINDKIYPTRPVELLARSSELIWDKLESKCEFYNEMYQLELSSNQKTFLANNLFNLFLMANKAFKFCEEFNKNDYKYNSTDFSNYSTKHPPKIK